ncbi:MAG: hypothetical protein ABI605_08840 [Rhizobacter sp.]
MQSPEPLSPEHWETHAGDAGVALLDIPPDALRERRFEVFCSLSVAGLGDDAWHQMQVLVNGSQEWLRREDTHAGGRDSLDYRFRRVVPPGQPLRVTASSELHRTRRLHLSITADED